MNDTQRISVVINTYNAEQHLKAVIEAVKDFDEIVICDMESTDETLNIARSYGCKIVTFPKVTYALSSQHASLLLIKPLLHGYWW